MKIIGLIAAVFAAILIAMPAQAADMANTLYVFASGIAAHGHTIALAAVAGVPIADQITAFEQKRAALVATNEGIMTKAAEAGSTLDADQEEAFDDNQKDIEAIDKHLVRLRAMEKSSASRAQAVTGKNGVDGTQSRSGPTIIIKGDADEKFEGQNFTRLVIAKTLARIEGVGFALEVARKRWADRNPTLVQVVRAAVAGGGSDSGEWGAELVTADGRYTGDFIDYLYARTLFDNLPLREVPANVTIKGQDGTATAYWVGQSKSIPVSKPDFFNVNLTPLKVAALAVVSKELLRDSTPAAEMLVRDALVEASAQKVDGTFFSAAAAVPGVSPAGILNGVTAIPSAGNDVDGLITDIKALYAPFITANNASGLQYATTESLAKSIGLMQNALGQDAFPGITASGGTLKGDPISGGGNVGAGDLILMKPSDIYKIGDRGVEVSMSTEAAIEMADNPAGASDTPTANASVVSMFQTESVALKVVRPLNFAKRRASAVAYVGDADYGTPVTP
ncbi:phage major capsid protein [Sphingomonas sp. HT-1]|uniref:phage major capsid protein n=1 Tax=unclassified Sphingomonas TaxID=196159 RepID=UPI0003083372|nr:MULTISPECIES: phage major capsid protein [unclassified Sphingomonas]KTF68673.1 hypothetical protein ATB93_13190 [Sphingomonas sp. WG]